MLKQFEESNMLDLKSIGGSNFGGLIALSKILGYSYTELESLIFEKMEKPFKIVNENSVYFMTQSVPRISLKYGLSGIEKIEKIISNIFTSKDVSPDITFIELFDKYNIDFVCTGKNVSREKNELFSSNLTPKMSVKTALMISNSIALIFDPVVYNNNIYIEGGGFLKMSREYFKKYFKEYTTSNSCHLAIKPTRTQTVNGYKNVFEFYINFIGQNMISLNSLQVEYSDDNKTENVLIVDVDNTLLSIYPPVTNNVYKAVIDVGYSTKLNIIE